VNSKNCHMEFVSVEFSKMWSLNIEKFGIDPRA
jgi:hypothetical protein